MGKGTALSAPERRNGGPGRAGAALATKPGPGRPGAGIGGRGIGGGGGPAFALRNLRTLDSLKIPAFRLFFGAMVGQNFAMNMQIMARSLLVYRLTGSATTLGIMALANSIPMLLFSLFGGVLADRVPKKYVILVTQAASAVLAFLVALALWSGLLSKENTNSWWLLVAYSVGSGIIMGATMPARQAIIPEIVGTERLMNAVALTQFPQNGMRLLAPAVAGFLIEWIGFEAIYLAMTVMYGVSLVFVLFLPVTGTRTTHRKGALGDIMEGFRYIQRDTTIFTVLALTLVMVFLSTPYMTLLPIFADDILKVGAQGMGLLLSASGIGAVITSLVLASLPNKKRGLIFLVGSVLLGVSLMAFAFSSVWTLSLVLIGVVGVFQMVRQGLANTLLQYYVEDEYRGRVMSVYLMEFGLTSFGSFFAALLADTSLGVEWSVGGLAFLLIILSLLFIAFVPRVRGLE